MHEVRIPVPIRGLQLLVQFLVLIIAFGLLRPRLNTDPTGGGLPTGKTSISGILSPARSGRIG
jgi:hypothetical protein